MPDQPDKIPHLIQPDEPLVPEASATSETALTTNPISSPAKDTNDLNEAAKQTFLWNVHSYLGEYARFADTKAAFTGTLAAALIGALYSADLFERMFSAWPSAWSITNWVALASSVFLVATIVLTICTVYPRLRPAPGQGFIF